MSISLCMIAKNEEKFIGKALESIKEFVDEIIVVDTGSTDKTKEIALSYGAFLKESKWKKDFSYHRNECIRYATSDWILFIDCDEALQFQNVEVVKEILDKNNMSMYDFRGYNLNIVNIIEGKEIASFDSLRIFRNNCGFHFKNPIHEQIITSIVEKYGEESIGELPLAIYHYGYDDKLVKMKEKRNRNLEILNTIENKDGYLYAMTGDEYLKDNNLKEAKKYYELSLNRTPIVEKGYALGLVINYVSTLINLKEYQSALSFIKYARECIVCFKDLYFLEFWIYFYSRDNEMALKNLDKYIELSKTKNSNIVSVKNFEQIYNLEILRNKCLSIT